MTFTLAAKTMKQIDAAIEKDQGAAFRQFLEKVLPAMKDAYRGVEDIPFRTHLGASVIGGECARHIWYGFRWSHAPVFKGRILRLFNRGHLEEARFIAMLLTIGCEVYQHDEQGNQFRISDVGGHLGGSGDGVAMGVPDVPAGYATLLEFKTHNDKSFKKLVAEGVRCAKFEHYVQMQMYMRKMGIVYGLYMAVNKNDDSVHAEIIVLDSSVGDQFIDRARNIILMPEAPKRISESPGWFACSWCDHKAICHQHKMPERNCRTCTFSDANADGNWYCLNPLNNTQSPEGVKVMTLDKHKQYAGCDNYVVMNAFG
jgi:hypothetical protein